MKDHEFLDTTVDEWMAEIERLIPKGDPGETVSELSQRLGLCKTTTRRWLAKLTRNKKCITGHGFRYDEIGRRFPAAVFQLNIEKEKK